MQSKNEMFEMFEKSYTPIVFGRFGHRKHCHFKLQQIEYANPSMCILKNLSSMISYSEAWI